MSETVDETQAEGFPATLDLSGADTRGNYMDSGWKEAVVVEVNMVETKNPDGNLPLETPGLNVKFTVDGGPFDNRNAWNTYWFPPADYDESKRARTLGMFVRFLVALGYDEAEIKSNGFSMDNAEELVGKECQINTKYDEQYDNNRITGVKARVAGSSNESGSGLL